MPSYLLPDFTRRLRQRCDTYDIFCGRWSGAHPTSANILAVGTKPDETLLYVKSRSEPPGFWGLTANRIAELETSGKRWYVILLIGSAQTGYVLLSSLVVARTSTGAWKLAADGDHKVHEDSDLSSFRCHSSFDSIVAACLPGL